MGILKDAAGVLLCSETKLNRHTCLLLLAILQLTYNKIFSVFGTGSQTHASTLNNSLATPDACLALGGCVVAAALSVYMEYDFDNYQ